MKSLVLGILFILNCASAFDHTHKDFSVVLGKYVSFADKQSLVQYAKLKKESKKLEAYLKSLSSVSKDEYKKFSKDEQLAFLINAYNAFTLKLIINHYPIKSIKDTGSLFTNPWKKKFFTFLGEKNYLDHIEHGMIRRDFKEPRIHFAVNCASVGCPSLQTQAFTPKNLEELLEKGAQHFIKNEEKNRVKGNKLYLSKIFKWYGSDFEILGGFKQYVMKTLKLKGDYEIEFMSYDWNLNDKK